MNTEREREVTQAFVSLANSLVDDFDVVDLLDGLTTDCARLLDIASAGLLLADGRQVLHVMAASSEATRTLELFQVQREQGPCRDCYLDGAPINVADLGQEKQRWPQFVPAATTAGFVSVHAVPLRLHGTVLGTLGLFGATVGDLGEDDLSLAQALAHVASIAIVQGAIATDTDTISRQLQTALRSRVVLEQAKGFLAQTGQLDMDQAFAALRRYSSAADQRLTDVATALVSRALPARHVLAHAPTTPARAPGSSPG